MSRVGERKAVFTLQRRRIFYLGLRFGLRWVRAGGKKIRGRVRQRPLRSRWRTNTVPGSSGRLVICSAIHAVLAQVNRGLGAIGRDRPRDCIHAVTTFSHTPAWCGLDKLGRTDLCPMIMGLRPRPETKADVTKDYFAEPLNEERADPRRHLCPLPREM